MMTIYFVLSLDSDVMNSTAILLHPRPYEKYAGILLLVPLLPKPKPLKPLPAEIWSEIFSFVLGTEREGRDILRLLTHVCKSFHVSGLLY